MKKSTKALLYNFLGFAPIFMLTYFLVQHYTNLTGFWVPATSFMVTLLLSPKFQAGKVYGEEKLFMRWLFIKGVKEIK
ncbi:hypothetical protein ACLI1A_16325 [Flavobacterium sp. RHBU_3]|uniref:hypothetical protein n=1 Tax=Flavobacterium sp. RHBU_3 TaxID=3391184 RepID=UPI003984F495